MAKDNMTKIKTSMSHAFPKTTKPRVMKEHPRKLAKGEKSNEVDRPSKH